ncbi:hypothetical protein ACTFIZ_004369 [Dictyostelium cf. discoideum]
MNGLKITIDNGNGESTISGNAYPMPTPKIFPPPIFLRFSQHETKGTLWDNKDFHVKSGKIEYNGEEFDIPVSDGSWDKYDEVIELRIHTRESPKKFFNPTF